jgi:hypothetical protein
MWTTDQIPFTSDEIRMLNDSGFEEISDDLTVFRKSHVVMLGCGCCCGVDDIDVTKSVHGVHVEDKPWECPATSEVWISVEQALEKLGLA